MSELSNRLNSIQEELKKIKTTQKTSSDSYIFYRYSFSDTSTTSGFASRTYQATFIPYNKGEDYIVNFYLSDRYAPKVEQRAYISLTNKNSANFIIQAPQAVKRFEAYLVCYATVSGELKVDPIDEFEY